MGWENRNGGLYYYRKERSGSRVVSQYVGSGETAGLIGMLEVARRDEQETERADERAKIAALKAQDAADAAIFEAVDVLTGAALAAAGCRQHKGTWRKKRERE